MKEMNEPKLNKRVLHLNSCGAFSTGNIAGQILEELPDTWGGKLIFAHDDSKYPFAQKIAGKNTIFWHVVFNRLFGRHGRYSIINTFKILREIKKFKPDILHLHNIHGYYINYSMLFKFIKKVELKVVWTLHDCWSFTGFCSHYDYNQCQKWQSQCGNCEYIHNEGYKSWYFDISKSEFERKKKSFTNVKDLEIVCPSEWLAGEVKKSFLSQYPTCVINNGIDLKNFTKVDNHSYDEVIDRTKKIVLAVASTWDERKGYKDIIKLSQLLSNEYQVVMVGVSNAQYEELSDSKIVAIQSTKNQVQLAELYSMACVFVNTTNEDNFPTVNIESIACGCPMITYNSGGSVEIPNAFNGFIVPKADLNAMINTIQSVDWINERTVLESRSEEIFTKYSKERMAKDYLKIYMDRIDE